MRFFFLFIFITSITCLQTLAQITPDKKENTFNIDFSNIKKAPTKKAADTPNTKSTENLNQNFSSFSINTNKHHLSQKSISGFNFNSRLNLEGFGKLQPKQIQFGKASEVKKYITSQQPRFLENEKGSGPVYQRDQYLGDITTKSDTVEILCRDYADEDSDMVQLLVNDKIYIHRIILKNPYYTVKLKLEEGFNKIDFLALNTGKYAPNTAQFKILDNQFNKISDERWSLSTGFKATIIIIKE